MFGHILFVVFLAASVEAEKREETRHYPNQAKGYTHQVNGYPNQEPMQIPTLDRAARSPVQQHYYSGSYGYTYECDNDASCGPNASTTDRQNDGPGSTEPHQVFGQGDVVNTYIGGKKRSVTLDRVVRAAVKQNYNDGSLSHTYECGDAASCGPNAHTSVEQNYGAGSIGNTYENGKRRRRSIQIVKNEIVEQKEPKQITTLDRAVRSPVEQNFFKGSQSKTYECGNTSSCGPNASTTVRQNYGAGSTGNTYEQGRRRRSLIELQKREAVQQIFLGDIARKLVGPNPALQSGQSNYEGSPPLVREFREGSVGNTNVGEKNS